MKAILIVLLFSLAVESCSSLKNSQIIRENNAINVAINDCLKNKKFIKGDSIFSVSFQEINDDMIAVTISAKRNKINVTTVDEKNYSYNSFPTNFIEKDGLLFFWNDTTQKIVPTELLDKLYAFNKVDTAILYKNIPEYVIDDSQKAAHYFFCKTNLKNYKAKITKYAIGYFKTPSINCDK